MNRLLLLAAFLLSLPAVALAGRLQGVTLSGAPLITVRGGNAQVAPLQATSTITNASGRSLRLGLQRQIRSEVSGSENNFCFGVNCYPPTVTTAPSPITLANGGTDNSMVLDYTPNNYAGITVIRYALYEVGTQDSTYLTVRFDATQRTLATAASRAPESVLSQPWPNPAAAGTAVAFSYDAATAQRGTLQLISLATGATVARQSLGQSLAGRLGHDFGQSSGIGAGSLVVVGGPRAEVLVLPFGLQPGLYSCLLLDFRGQLLAARRLQVQ